MYELRKDEKPKRSFLLSVIFKNGNADHFHTYNGLILSCLKHSILAFQKCEYDWWLEVPCDIITQGAQPYSFTLVLTEALTLEEACRE